MDILTQYFDEESNVADIASYYKDINPDTNDFTEKIRELLIKSHTTKLDYKPSLYLYPIVDRQESGKLSSIYSGKEFQLDEILALDAQIDIRRKSIIETHSLLKKENLLTKEELDRIERENPFNCEHVVCQSWFNEKDPMKGDLHHLFTCEVKCNQFRGNLIYFDFADYKEVIKDECGKSENNVFEPERNKGIVARVVLYFLLRYPGVINQYDSDGIKMLGKWHSDEPVTLYEKHRNQCIYHIQGNRNPIIDFPEWSDHLNYCCLPDCF